MPDLDRLLNPHPARHYRRTYLRGEAAAGAAVLLVLALVAAWVAWRGAHPDPALFAPAPELTWRGPGTVDRGPLPADLAPAGWTELGLAHFGPDDLYEKINGREGFYKSYGFQRLTAVRYLDPDDETRSIDVEAYDLGEAANAVGCLSAEAGPERPPTPIPGGLVSADVNARFLARGPYYLRLVAPDAQAQEALDHLQDRLVAGLAGEELPWSFVLFASLGIPAERLAYYAEDAFSLAGATRVHAGEVDDEGTTLFVSEVGEGAAATSESWLAGFERLGDRIAERWVQDRYLDRVSTAVAAGPFVAGVYSAEDVAQGEQLLQRLLAALPGETGGAEAAPVDTAEVYQ